MNFVIHFSSLQNNDFDEEIRKKAIHILVFIRMVHINTYVEKQTSSFNGIMLDKECVVSDIDPITNYRANSVFFYYSSSFLQDEYGTG